MRSYNVDATKPGDYQRHREADHASADCPLDRSRSIIDRPGESVAGHPIDPFPAWSVCYRVGGIASTSSVRIALASDPSESRNEAFTAVITVCDSGRRRFC